MVNAGAIVAAYLKDYIDDIGKHYQWEFDESKAREVTGKNYSNDKSWYANTVALKQDLRVALGHSEDETKRMAIVRYFIEDWGKVTTNKDLEKTIEPFADLAKTEANQDSFKEHFARKGISSWSKYMSLCFDWAAIYDSRVAYSINAILFMNGNINRFFPIPEGRSPRLQLIDIETLYVLSLLKNGSLKLADELKHKHFSSRVKKQFHIPQSHMYVAYLDLLNETAEELGLATEDFHKVEMLLFALAPEKVLADLIDHINN